MAIQLKDRILTLCTTVGTNDAIVGATKEGYQGWEGITMATQFTTVLQIICMGSGLWKLFR